MHWHPIPLELTTSQIKQLKAQNARLIEHLEKHLPLRGKELDELAASLSDRVNETPALVEILKQLPNSGDYFAVQLLHPDNEILNLPWSLAQDSVSEKPLGQLPRLLLAKGLPGFTQEQLRLPEVAPPLKILIVISSPEDSEHTARLDYEAEERQILHAFQPLLAEGLVAIDFAEDAALETLQQKLKANQYHVLHFSGHAEFRNGQSQLMLEDPLTLKRRDVSGSEFAETVNCRPDDKIPLVVLASCQSAQGSSEAGLRGATNHLLRVGIPAVISMGLAVQDHYAAVFSARFYAEIAQKQSVLAAFNAALAHTRDQEFDALAKQTPNPRPLQWIIPNLYLAGPLEHLVDWHQATRQLKLTSHRFIYEQDRLVLQHRDRYRFIGRRRDKSRILPQVFANQPVLLKGQGGVGKTALAEHLVQRLIAANPATHPFVFTEKSTSFKDLQNVLQDFLDEKGCLRMAELNAREPGMKQFRYLVGEIQQVCRPVFIFDNLEDFQTRPGAVFKPEYSDVKVIIEFCCTQDFPVILTARYPLPDFPNVTGFDLNQVSLNDFWKKCQVLELQQLGDHLRRQQPLKRLEGGGVDFFEIVKWLHATFGGNYRALEIFNEFFRQQPEKLLPALDSLETFLRESTTGAETVKLKMSESLKFGELLALLEPAHRQILQVLTRFRIPVQALALKLQPVLGEPFARLPQRLETLNNLTLIEMSLDPELNQVYYYCTPLVTDLLGTAPVDFRHAAAGSYHLHCARNLETGLSDLEEAFFHFSAARVKPRVQEIGDQLSKFYYRASLYRNALVYAHGVFQLLGEATEPGTVNLLGQILYIFGQYDQALAFFQMALKGYQAAEDKSGEGVTLNNISQIYQARGDYAGALSYLERDLKICQELGDKSGEGVTLNNISQIYKARGDYAGALSYLARSLKISQEIGDKSGEGVTLSNISQIYRARGDNEKALSYLERSLKIFQEIGDKLGEGVTLNNISQIYKARGDYAGALSYLERSLKIRQEIGDKSGEGVTLNNISQIYQARGDYARALSYLARSLKISQEIGDIPGEAVTCFNIAQIMEAQGNLPQAIRLVQRTIEIDVQTGHPDLESDRAYLRKLEQKFQGNKS